MSAVASTQLASEPPVGEGAAKLHIITPLRLCEPLPNCVSRQTWWTWTDCSNQRRPHLQTCQVSSYKFTVLATAAWLYWSESFDASGLIVLVLFWAVLKKRQRKLRNFQTIIRYCCSCRKIEPEFVYLCRISELKLGLYRQWVPAEVEDVHQELAEPTSR